MARKTVSKTMPQWLAIEDGRMSTSAASSATCVTRPGGIVELSLEFADGSVELPRLLAQFEDLPAQVAFDLRLGDIALDIGQ